MYWIGQVNNVLDVPCQEQIHWRVRKLHFRMPQLAGRLRDRRQLFLPNQTRQRVPGNKAQAACGSDLCGHSAFKRRKEAHAAIFEYIEMFYNRTRLHSTLDYLSPVEYEQL